MPRDDAISYLRSNPVPTAEKMPTMTRLEKLQALKALLPASGRQGSWETCLWSEARKFKPFLDAGMPPSKESVYEFFGFKSLGEYWNVFDQSPKLLKRYWLWKMIREEKARMQARGEQTMPLRIT